MTNPHQTPHCFSLLPHLIVAHGAMPADEEKTFRMQNNAYRMICATEAVIHFRFRAGIQLARAVSYCLILSLVPAVSQTDNPPTWRDARSLADLIDHLELWLDANSSLPRNNGAPAIRFVNKNSAAALSASENSAQTNALRGLYDPDSQTISLVRPWSPRDPHDVSVLLHELMHHRQADAGHWQCIGEQEFPAYRMQQYWLAEFGLEPDVNWFSIVLQAGCVPRDVHPD